MLAEMCPKFFCIAQMSSSIDSDESTDSEFYYSNGMSSAAMTLVLLGMIRPMSVKAVGLSPAGNESAYSMVSHSGFAEQPISPQAKPATARARRGTRSWVRMHPVLRPVCVCICTLCLRVTICQTMPESEHVNADRKVFEAKRSASSVTGESKAVEGLVEGRHITVVDTPGMSHPSGRCSAWRTVIQDGRGARIWVLQRIEQPTRVADAACLRAPVYHFTRAVHGEFHGCRLRRH